MSSILRCTISAALLLFAGIVCVEQAQARDATSHLVASRGIAAPPGFASACGRYDWLCGSRSGRHMNDSQLLALARQVNSEVNRSVRAMTDLQNYGKAEHWTLPYNGRGDCEDFALLKKKKLLDRGVRSQNLFLAVALDRSGTNHTVLVVRLDSGYYILDNLTGAIVQWNRTGYTFIASQNPNSKRAWVVTLGGPRAAQLARANGERVIGDTAVASQRGRSPAPATVAANTQREVYQ